MDRVPFQVTSAGALYDHISTLPVAVMLDNVRSLYNVGAFFRTADAARIDELSKQIAAQSEQLAKAQAELETLKSAPAAGGPEGKPSGEDRTTVAKGEEPAAPRPLHEVLAAAGDTHGANEAIALQLLHRTAIAVGPPSE